MEYIEKVVSKSKFEKFRSVLMENSDKFIAVYAVSEVVGNRFLCVINIPLETAALTKNWKNSRVIPFIYEYSTMHACKSQSMLL